MLNPGVVKFLPNLKKQIQNQLNKDEPKILNNGATQRAYRRATKDSQDFLAMGYDMTEWLGLKEQKFAYKFVYIVSRV